MIMKLLSFFMEMLTIKVESAIMEQFLAPRLQQIVLEIRIMPIVLTVLMTISRSLILKI